MSCLFIPVRFDWHLAPRNDPCIRVLNHYEVTPEYFMFELLLALFVPVVRLLSKLGELLVMDLLRLVVTVCLADFIGLV